MKRRNFLRRFLLSVTALVLFPAHLRKNETEAASVPLKPAFKPDPSSWKDNQINIAWIGHSTLLINFYGKIILTDPVLFERVGLYFWGVTFGPSRYTHPALTVDEIPKPDLILLSHAHMDHMDYKTLVTITDQYPGEIDCITAYNTKDVIEELQWKSLQEMDWEDSLEINGMKFTAIEVKHFGWRYPWERDRSKGYMEDGRSYNAYMIERNDKRILFGGDTAFSEKFRNGQDNPTDIVIMPIGAYQPWRKNHCNPEEALIMAAEHLNGRTFIPCHCNTFKQGTEPQDEPLTWLLESGPKYNIDVVIDKIGKTYTTA